jgi:SAM-dependent methyltransferase
MERMTAGDWSAASTGTGPGVITPDGCAVDFYALAPPGPEPAIVHASAGSAHASVLELGAGTGRIADVLAGMGHDVVAVDESPEMLVHDHAAGRCAAADCARLCGPRFRQVPDRRQPVDQGRPGLASRKARE